MLEDKQQSARQKLVQAALITFAEKGYEGASTREIADKAGANISSIRYYFGDKAGLYRAAYTEPLCGTPFEQGIPDLNSTDVDTALRQLFRDFLEPLKHGETFRLVMKLHFREMIEPTGAWEHEIDAEIKPQHMALVNMLTAYFGLSKPDLDIQRLAFAMMGMAVNFYVAQDVVDVVCPKLMGSAKAIDTLSERLAAYARAMLDGESKRRKQDCSS